MAWNSEGDVPSLFGLPEHATKVPSPTPVGVFRLGREVSERNPLFLSLCSPSVQASLPFYSEPYRFFNLDVFECLKDVEGGILWS